MSRRLVTVNVSTPFKEVVALLHQGLVPIVLEGETFVGLATRMDVVNHLRRKLRASA